MKRLTNSGTKEVTPDVTIREVINKLAEYEDLDEQGRILKLPCAVGDTVWKINSAGEISHCIVSTIEIKEYGIFFSNATHICTLKDFGKTVFTSEKASKSALKNDE